MKARAALRVAVGAGLAVLALAAIGNRLSPPWEPRELPAGSGYGSLVPEPASPAEFANGEVRSEDVRVPVRDEVLRGTVFSPAGPGRHPAVVLVHGAGPGTRSRLAGLAESFARAGIVALAYDKRTVGYATVTNRNFGLLADDALAAVRLLQRRGDVDPARVGLWGISEGGGWVAPAAASRAPDDVAFAVLVSAPVVTPRQQLVWGAETGLSRLDAPRGLRSAAAKALGMGGFDYTDHDPLPAMEGVDRPVLAIYGTEDTAVPVVQSSREMAAALKRGGNFSYAIRFFSGADHGLRTGEDRLAPGYLRTMTEWVRGLPDSAEPPGARVAGATPTQRYAADEAPPPPPYATGRALAVALGLAALCFLAGPVAALIVRRGGSGGSAGDDGAWREIRRPLRLLAAAAISTHLLFNLVLGSSVALALSGTGSPHAALWVNGAWLAARLSALTTVVLAVASIDASVSSSRDGWRPTAVQAASLAGSFGAAGVLLLVAAYWDLFAFRW